MASKQSNDSRIRFPIEQKEQAAQREHSTLLARDIYKDLADLLEDGLKSQPDQDDLDQHRSHNAILIDGKRGTGKSSVLVNLNLYLESERADLAKAIHVLKPVDPTLLEDTDDLFLNVIVAAIIRDKSVAEALSRADHKAEEFHLQLQVLGNTLEQLQSQRNKYGLDKVRAFMGSHDLNKQVHELFKKSLELIGKKLLVLPIDDVDTSLNRAFENLEVVRRYLTSPYVQPIISGDLALYHEVTWRDFYSKLTQNSKIKTRDALDTAKSLATEYQRKIMPLQLRRDMPTAANYLVNEDILLCKDTEEYFSLPVFWRWIDALLNERLNTPTERRLSIKLETVRELTQLIFAFRQNIPDLSGLLKRWGPSITNEWALHRAMIMPIGIIPALNEFSREYHRAQRLEEKTQRETASNHAYQNFFNTKHEADPLSAVEWRHCITEAKKVLLNYLHHEHASSAASLALEADAHILNIQTTPTARLSTLFKATLFQPTQLTKESALSFPAALVRSNLDEWKKHAPKDLQGIVSLEERHPYALAEVGHAIKRYDTSDLPLEAQFLAELMLHRSFFSESRKTNMIFTGRLFELVIASLVRNLEPNDLSELVNRAPFYSVPALSDDDLDPQDLTPEDSAPDTYIDPLTISLAKNINDWRTEHRIDEQTVSGWLIYNVMNSYFAKSWEFNKPLKPNQNPADPSLRMLSMTARRAFRTLWNAFASLEKGEVFGMPSIVTSFSMGDKDRFEQGLAYRQNILPFLRRHGEQSFGGETRSFTSALVNHPILRMIENLQKYADQFEDSDFEEEWVYPPTTRSVTEIIKRHFEVESIGDAYSVKVAQDDIEAIRDFCISQKIPEDVIDGNPHFQYLTGEAGK
ncbi:hypothetical protein JET64_11980 [Pseudomonas putida]|nr:hypothetical protein [Pseudomonas putida]